jgi:adhesin transport system membrane fusion protein
MNPFSKNPAKLPAMKSSREHSADADEKRTLADFVDDADATLVYQEPLRARAALWAVAAIIVALLLWAHFAEIDELTRGEGRVIAARHLQVMQSVDGGIITDILVTEGQQVKEGEVLLRLDQTRPVSNLRENQSQSYSLLAKAARLKALADGRPFEPPPQLAAPEFRILLEQERALYASRQSEIDASLSVVRQQLAQRHQELVEMQARHEQAKQSYELTAKELTLTKPLIASGAVSDVEIIRLDRDVARYRGERDQAAAQIQRIHAAAGESQRKMHEIQLEFRNRARSELSDTNAKLASLGEGSVQLSDKVKQTTIRSPVTGTVQRLLVKTVGGVIQAGRDILEIVPSQDTLLVEARVLPRDIAFLRPEQPAYVRLTAYDSAIYGGLDAVLEHISSDSVIDDKGNAFYIVRVRTRKPGLGPTLPIIPGMVAEVDIRTGKKSVLSYLLKPVLRGRYYALTER